MPFDAIIGQKKPIRILRSMFKTGQVPHAFVFYGVDGIGKLTVAVSFAKALNCQEAEGDFCDCCPSCRKIDRRVHPDIQRIEPEKNVIKIEQVRALQKDIGFKSLEAKKKAVIIDQAEKLNVQAANCLLKTLEEPPDETVLILVARSTASMLATVLSRCQTISFTPLTDEEIMQFLFDRAAVDKQRAALITKQARGSIERAIYLLESDFLNRRNEIAEMLVDISQGNLDAVFKLAGLLNDAGEHPMMLEFLLAWHRDVLLLKEGLSESLLYNPDIIDSMSVAAGHETRDGTLQKIKKIQWMQNSAGLNIDMQLGLEAVFMQ